MPGGEWEAYSCAGKQLGRQSEANKSSKARLAGEETEAPECRVTPLMKKQSVLFQSKGESKEAQSPFMFPLNLLDAHQVRSLSLGIASDARRYWKTLGFRSKLLRLISLSASLVLSKPQFLTQRKVVSTRKIIAL